MNKINFSRVEAVNVVVSIPEERNYVSEANSGPFLWVASSSWLKTPWIPFCGLISHNLTSCEPWNN